MNKLSRFGAVAVLAALALCACGPSDEEMRLAAEAAAAAADALPVPMPGPAADASAWQKYLVSVVKQNMKGVKTNHPYMYFVPAGDDPAVQDQRKNQLDNVSVTVARGVLPGNMMAFGGPNSTLTADMIVAAFKTGQDGAFKGVVVLFVGAAADSDRVKDALVKSAAEYRFVEMK